MPSAGRRTMVVAALVAAVALSITAVSAFGASGLRLSAATHGFKFNKKTLRARHGTVTIAMHNPSSTRHGIAIQGRGVDKDGKIVGKGRTSTLTVSLKPGRYTFYCPVKGHRALGMKGTLIVT